MILAQNKKAKWDSKKHLSLENKADGRLTYAEFQADLEKKLTPSGVDKTLVAPGGDGFKQPTVAEAVDKLKMKGWAMPMDVAQVTSGASNDYNELMGRVNKKFQAYYNTLGNDEKWNRKLIETNQRTSQLSKEIVSLRQQEVDEWVLKQMTREVDPPNTPENKKGYGLGLSRDDLVITNVQSSVDGATTWERVDFGESFMGMNEAQSEAFEKKLAAAGIKGGVIGLVNWADNLGNPNFANFGPGYTEQNGSHFRVHEVWKSLYNSAVKRMGGLSGSCSR
jgi:hypothetical protein